MSDDIVEALRAVQADTDDNAGDYYADQFSFGRAGEAADEIVSLRARVSSLETTVAVQAELLATLGWTRVDRN